MKHGSNSILDVAKRPERYGYRWACLFCGKHVASYWMDVWSEAQFSHRFPEAGFQLEKFSMVALPYTLRGWRMIQWTTPSGNTNGSGTIEEKSGTKWPRTGLVMIGSAKERTKFQQLTRHNLYHTNLSIAHRKVKGKERENKQAQHRQGNKGLLMLPFTHAEMAPTVQTVWRQWGGWQMYTHSVSHAHFSDTFSLRGVQTSRTRMAQGVCSGQRPPSRPWRLHLCCRTVLHPKARVWRTSARAGGVWLPGRSHALHRLWAQRVRHDYFCRRRHDAHQRSELR